MGWRAVHREELAPSQVFGLEAIKALGLTECGIESEDLDDPFEQAARKQRALRLTQLMVRKLTPKQERVIRLLSGIKCSPHTYKQVAQEFNLTVERIRQIECRALRKLGKRQQPTSYNPKPRGYNQKRSTSCAGPFGSEKTPGHYYVFHKGEWRKFYVKAFTKNPDFQRYFNTFLPVAIFDDGGTEYAENSGKLKYPHEIEGEIH